MFYLVQAGSSLQVIDADTLVVQTLVLPSGVTIDATRRAQFAVIDRKVVITNSPSVNLWLDPATLTLYPLSITAPPTAPTLSASGVGLTGAYVGAYSYGLKVGGILVAESPLSPIAAPFTLANQGLHYAGVTVSAQTFVNCRRIYRSVSGGTDLFEDQDIDDNTTTAITSTTSDAALSLLPANPDVGNAAGVLTILAVWKNRLWARTDTVNLRDHVVYTESESAFNFSLDNDIPIPTVGEDAFGITGFLARRDELGILKRNKVTKVIGNSNTDFQLVIVAEGQGIGCVAPLSCVVINDVGYFLGPNGVYTLDAGGVQCISDSQVQPWFLSDTYFNRSLFASAFAGYNPKTGTYDLHLCAAGSTEFDRWVSYDPLRREWLGPHKTDALVPTSRGALLDTNALILTVIGGDDGYLYTMNNSGARDLSGVPLSVPTGIAIDWITKFYSDNHPDRTHVWLQTAVLLKKQGVAATAIVVTPRVGSLDATDGTPQNIPQTSDRARLARFGTGRLLRLEFTHSTAGDNVLLYAIELPVIDVGRR